MGKTDHNAHSVYLMYYHLIMVVKSIEHSISFPNLSDRRTEDTSRQNIWLLSFPVQSNA